MIPTKDSDPFESKTVVIIIFTNSDVILQATT